jgi:hypothetical protein
MLQDMSVSEILGWPFSSLLEAMHGAGLSWAAAIVIACVLARALLLPVSYFRTRSARILAIISVKRAIELHQTHADDPQTYREVFRSLYMRNRVSPASIFGWYLVQLLLFMCVAVGFREVYPQLEHASVLGASVVSQGASSWLGRGMVAIEVLVLLSLLWRSRRAYEAASWYLRLGAAALVVFVTGLIGLLLFLPLLAYIIVMLAFAHFDWPLIQAYILWRCGPQGWPVYDEHGTVIAYGLDDVASGDAAAPI